MDRSRPLLLGDERSYVDLGTFHDIVFSHDETQPVSFRVEWKRTRPLKIKPPEASKTLLETDHLCFQTTVGIREKTGLQTLHFAYDIFTKEEEPLRFGMQYTGENNKYDLIAEGYTAKRNRGRAWPLPPPIKCYGFPDEVYTYYQNVSFLSEFVLAFEQQMNQVYYLGPLREYPRRIYVWSGDQPEGVGLRGELAIHALLAADRKGIKISTGYRRRRKTVAARVAEWLRQLGLIHSFDVKPLGEHRKEYEVRVRRYRSSPEVALTDIGFGISQILPVLTLCYYAPEGSTILLEQPEIHLHPSVQAGLADVFIDAVKHHNVQIIIESHSEHLLRRLQRRIAEEHLQAEDTALYFITCDKQGISHAQALNVDEYGFIRNWPEHFFGDEMGEIVAMNKAALQRQQQATEEQG